MGWFSLQPMRKGMPQASRTLRQSLEVSARTRTAQPFQLLSFFVPVDALCFVPTAQDSPVPTFSDQDPSSRDRLVGRRGFKAHQTITALSPEPTTHRSSAFLSHRPTKCSFVLSNLSITLWALLEASTQAEDERCRTCLPVCSWPRSPTRFRSSPQGGHAGWRHEHIQFETGAVC